MYIHRTVGGNYFSPNFVVVIASGRARQGKSEARMEKGGAGQTRERRGARQLMKIH